MIEKRPRNEVPEGDVWDLSTLYLNALIWEQDFAKAEACVPEIEQFKGRLQNSAEELARALVSYIEQERTLSKLYVHARLRSDEDTANSEALGYVERISGLFSRFGAAASFLTPELLAIPEETLETFLKHEALEPYVRFVRDIIRYKKHTLSSSEEALLALGSEVFDTSGRIFSQLNNADLDFGAIEVEGVEKPLTHGSFVLFLHNQNRDVRARAHTQFYSVIDAHKNTLAASLGSSLKKDAFLAQAKNFSSSRSRSLFGDNMPESVYDNLVDTVSKNLAPLHRYYSLRSTRLELTPLKLFDTYVPLVKDIEMAHSFDAASELILNALAPLGEEYCSILRKGLLVDRWVDRYENKGKRSGAYSSGCYDSSPYILMNFKEKSLDDVFTLAHEAGHSMHSYFSNRCQSFQDSGYTIFVAEVASTLNEILLADYLMKQYANESQVQAYLVNKQLDDIKGTFFRQTMFAEFELAAHARADSHQTTTLQDLRTIYRSLLEKYFGRALEFSPTDDLECLRIPHFYSSFYVYKYATGLSAANTLSIAILAGDKQLLKRYLDFLSAGCSKFPLDLLRDAGVDLQTSDPIESTIAVFSKHLENLEHLLIRP